MFHIRQFHNDKRTNLQRYYSCSRGKKRSLRNYFVANDFKMVSSKLNSDSVGLW